MNWSRIDPRVRFAQHCFLPTWLSENVIRKRYPEHFEQTFFSVNFSLRLLFLLTAVVGVFALCSLYLSPVTFLVSCTILPACLALIARYSEASSHGLAAGVAMASALSCSGLMLGFAYYQTFVTDSVQILKGGGWRSVANLSFAAVVGGLVCGSVALLIYFTVIVIHKYGFGVSNSSPN